MAGTPDLSPENPTRTGKRIASTPATNSRHVKRRKKERRNKDKSFPDVPSKGDAYDVNQFSAKRPTNLEGVTVKRIDLGMKIGEFVLDQTVIPRILSHYVVSLEQKFIASDFQYRHGVRAGYAMMAASYLACAASIIKSSKQRVDIPGINSTPAVRLYVPGPTRSLLSSFGDVTFTDGRCMTVCAPLATVRSLIFTANRIIAAAPTTDSENVLSVNVADINFSGTVINDVVSDPLLCKHIEIAVDAERRLVRLIGRRNEGYSLPALATASPYIPPEAYSQEQILRLRRLYAFYSNPEIRRETFDQVAADLGLIVEDGNLRSVNSMFTRVFNSISGQFAPYWEEIPCEPMVYSNEGGDPFQLYSAVDHGSGVGHDVDKVVSNYYTADSSRVEGYAFYPSIYVDRSPSMMFGSDNTAREVAARIAEAGR